MSLSSQSSKYTKLADEKSLRNAQVALESHGFQVKVVENLKAAETEVLNMIPKGSEVFTATSVTIDETNLSKFLMNLEIISQPEKSFRHFGAKTTKFSK